MQELSGVSYVILIVILVLAGLLIPFLLLSFLYIRSEKREHEKHLAELEAEANKGKAYSRKIIDKATGKEISDEHS
jgi:Na+/H+ antiporter NhaD/arsenite permease-like protein